MRSPHVVDDADDGSRRLAGDEVQRLCCRAVRLSALAARDLQQARDWFDRQEQGLGDTFLERVNEQSSASR
jgi:hypothetical protein